jgi:hypothetical protein
MNRSTLFADPPVDLPAGTYFAGPLGIRPRRVRRRRLRAVRGPDGRISLPMLTPAELRLAMSRQTALKLPPRMTNGERSMLADGKHQRLAFAYVARQGHRFQNVIPRDEQVDMCLAEMCRVIERWEPGRGALSTYLNQCFFYHLSKEAAKRGREGHVTRFSDMAEGWEPTAREEDDEEPWTPWDVTVDAVA